MVEKPVEKPIEQPVEQPVQQPAAPPAEPPAEESVTPAGSRRARRRTALQPLRTAVRRALTAGVTALDLVVPKAPGRLVFGGDEGMKYAGNPRELFEHAASVGGWDPYWVTGSREVFRAVEADHPGRAVRAVGLRALRIGVRARFFLVSHSRRDVGILGYSGRRRFINLTHGVGPKTMGYSKRTVDVAALDRETRTYAHVVCSSDLEATFWQRAYQVPLADVWPTGVPRNDVLVGPPDPSLPARHPVLRGTTVLYAPTFRDWALLPDYLPIPGMDPAPLVALLERHDATLLVRPHHYEADAARATIARVGSPRVQPADDAVFDDTNALLQHVDVLVTDYSSIYMDFLLLDRPIVFNPLDLEEYEAQRGFLFRYADHTPGAKVRTAEQFLAALEAELQGRDPYRADRARTRSLFFAHPEGGARERIMDRIRAQPVRWPAPPPLPRPLPVTPEGQCP